MSAIEQLIRAANAEAERLRHMANTTTRQPFRRVYERSADRWAELADEAKTELATIRPPDFTTP